MLSINRILCAVDFSAPSARALQYALALAERLGAQVDVIHVYEFPNFAVEDGAVELPPYMQESLAMRLRERLEQFVKEKAVEGPKTSTHLLEGIPYLQIVEAAKGHQADLVVIGTHGRTGLSHMMLGSVAERVVRTSEVPVLTIRSAGSP
jgi:nucleotide-binding universal stress UspA family protein